MKKRLTTLKQSYGPAKCTDSNSHPIQSENKNNLKIYNSNHMRTIYSFIVMLILSAVLIVNSADAQVTVSGALVGNGTYTSLTNAAGAFLAINGGAQTGANIIIDITGDVTTEAGTNSLNAGTWTSLLIRPSGGAARTISGTVAGAPMINLNGADYVTIDGLNTDGNSLTISNLSNSATSGTSTIKFIADATNNTITNCSILGSETAPLATNGGVVFISIGTTTGNDNIAISNCNIGPAGVNLPSKLIFGNGSTTNATVANSNITITNCNLYDYFLTGGCAAVYALTGNTDWNITNNKIYQTATRTFTAAGTMSGIYFSNSTYGNNIQITGNTIGYASNTGTGTLTLTGSGFAGAFQGIYLNAMTTAANACNLNSNIVSDISLTSSTGTFYGIYNATGASSNTININNNQVKNITLVTTTGAAYGIQWTSATNMTINGNNIYNISRNTAGTIYGITSASSSVNETVSNNNIYGLSCTNASTTSTIYGVYQLTATGTKIFQNNNVYNLTGSYGNTIYGMYVAYGTTTDVSSNNVYSLSTTSGTAGAIYGIYSGTTATTMNIYKNKVYNLSGGITASLVYGVYIAGGTTRNIYNNFVSDLKAPTATGANAVNGIYILGGTTVNLFFNTVYLNASGGTTFGSSGIYKSSTTASEFRNNIIVNVSTPGATSGNTVALRWSGVYNATYYTSTSNNNLFYAGTPGTNRLIYFDGTNSDQTIGAYQSRVTSRDANSFSELPPFNNTLVTPYNLHLVAGTPTLCESGGSPVSTPSITDDYDAESRNATTPDVGADEGAFTPKPNMSYVSSNTVQLTGSAFVGAVNQSILRIEVVTSGSINPISATNFLINANGTTNISDINTANANIYYTGTSSTFSTSNLFGSAIPDLTDYNITGSKTLSEGTNYFWLTYDISASASNGNEIDGECLKLTVAGSDQSPTTSAPAGSKTIVGPMAGTYYVGQGYSAPNFATITAAFADLQSRGVSGAVNLILTNNTATPYNTANGETFPLSLNTISGASGTNTITMKPNTGVTPIITGSSANSIIKLYGTDYFIIDGSNSGSTDRSLTIENTNAAATTASVWLASTGVGAGATYNTIKNCNLKTGSNTLTTSGISLGGATINSAGSDNDNNTIQNNAISKAYYGINVLGVSGSSSNNLNITGNTIGSNTSTDYVLYYGIYTSYTDNSIISQNEIYNMKQNGAKYGIYSATGSSFNTYSKNKIHDFDDLDGNAAITTAIGMAFETGLTDNSIQNNVIYKVFNRYGTTNNYQNCGIRIIGGTNFKLYYNSISMTGTLTRATAGIYVTCLHVYTTATTNMDLRNNIFHNIVTNPGYTVNNYTAYITSTSTFTNINYNDYYSSGTNLGYFNGTTCANLATWKTATTQDVNSISADPLFGSISDLRPGLGSLVLNAGTPIGTVTTDYLGVTRNATTPTIGSYEQGVDASGPTITYTAIPNTTSTSNVVLSGFAAITDVSGVNITSGTAPRLYYKKSTDANTYAGNTSGDNGWKWVEASNASTPFDFTIDYGIINGGSVILNDIIQYFVIAQDLASTPNVGINSGTFAAQPTSVSLTSDAFPLTGTINQFKIVGGALSGTYTVGLGAFNKATGKNLYLQTFTRDVTKEVFDTPTGQKTESKSDVSKDKLDLKKTNVIEKDNIDNSEQKGKVTTNNNQDLVSSHFADSDKSSRRFVTEVEEYQLIMENGKPYTGDNKVYLSNNGNTRGDQPNGVYNTITAAITDLSERGVSGAVTFSLVDATYTTETYPFVINSVSGVSATNTITIKPASGVSPIISGSSVSGPMFKIYNTNYVTIDGSNNGTTSRDMSITNTSTTAPQVIWIGSNGTTPITNVNVKNCNLKNGLNSSSAVIVSDGNTSGTAGYFNNITFQNNNIKQAYIGIYTTAVVAAGNGNGLTISDNTMNSTLTDALRLCGIYVQGVDGATVSNNTIGNFESATAETDRGIWFATGTINSTISGNTVTTLACTLTNSPIGISVTSGNTGANINITGNNVNGITSTTTASTSGINLGSTTSGVTIQKNIISDIKNTNSSGYNAYGIYLGSTATTSTASVINNIIYDVAGYGWNSTTTDNGYGIIVYSGGGYNIYNNSINLETNQTSATGLPACILITSTITTASTLDIRNNIFSIPATVGTNRYAIICNAANIVFANIDFNDYYSSSSNIGYMGSNISNINALKTATGKDNYSVSGHPGFTTATNLIPDVTNANSWVLSGNGTHLGVVTTDYSGTSRPSGISDGAPDIGAYEFGVPSVEPNNSNIPISGTPGLNNITVNGRVMGSLYFSVVGTVTSVDVKFYTGKNPPGTGGYPSSQFMNAYYTITPNSGASGFTYDVIYNYSEPQRGTILNENDIRLSKSDNSGTNWISYSDAGTGPNMYLLDVSANTIKVHGLTAFSTFTNSDVNAPLPVLLSSFNASLKGRDVTLAWKTESEINNAGFDIERKQDGTTDWKKAGFVAGKGTTNSPMNYTFEDKKLNSGKYNYRLKQIDNNGNFKYHNLTTVIDVALPTKFNMSQNYPNPFNPTTKIDFDLPFDSKVSIVLYDMTGREVKTLVNEGKTAGYYTVQFNASDLSSGTYFYRIITKSADKDFVVAKKMMLIK